MSDIGVCRTAQATPGLSIKTYQFSREEVNFYLFIFFSHSKFLYFGNIRDILNIFNIPIH